MDSLMMDVAVGLVFVFAVLAAMTSALTEFVASILGLRARYLLQGLRSLLDGDEAATPTPAAAAAVTAPSVASSVSTTATPATPGPGEMLSNALVANQGQRTVQPLSIGAPTREQLRKLPAYLPGRTFARAVVATLVPDAGGATSLTQIQAAVAKMDEGVLRKSLLSLIANADGEVDRFRGLVEEWYDDHMARVSGWYKRHVGVISKVIGVALVAALNVNSVAIARALYADEALREAVVTQAAAASGCEEGASAAECLKDLRKEMEDAGALGLPIGWSSNPLCEAIGDCSWAEEYGLADPADDTLAGDLRYVLLSVAGLILTALALAPGARFWFDLLGRFGTLRSSGPKPRTSAA